MRAFFVAALLIAGFGCAGPSFTMKPVQSDPMVFVGLATYHDHADAAAVRHDHPAIWSDADLRAILRRLLLQERGGLMDETRPPRPVFATDEIARLLPGLRNAFEAARPPDWVVFVLSAPMGSSAAPVVTSGAFFLENRRLHVILSNHRESVSPNAGERETLQAHPFRSLKGVRGQLTFDPPLYVVTSRANWLGGSSGPAASELVLDHLSFRDAANQANPGAPEVAMPASLSAPRGTGSPEAESEVGLLKVEVSKLREELAGLKRQLAEQAGELARLKTQPSTHPSVRPPNQPPRPSPGP